MHRSRTELQRPRRGAVLPWVHGSIGSDVLIEKTITDKSTPYFPGALFLLSSWYTRKELATRTAVLYTGSLLSSGFGGLVGAGVEYGLHGKRGLESWR